MNRKISKSALLFAFLGLFAVSACFEDLDDTVQDATTLGIQDFIWKALNVWYLYKPNVPDLADDRFANQEELENFLSTFPTPEDLYYDGLVADFDRFSYITSDYIALENQLAGVSMTNGMEYGLVRYPNNPSQVFGYVRYVLPGSDAAAKGIERGNIFHAVNGTQLTEDNFSSLLRPNTYEISLATFDGSDVTPTGQSVSLTKAEQTENPVHIAKTFEIEGQKIAYLMYNGFTSQFDDELNNAFGQFQAEGINELILDLRYNSGGSVRSAIHLSSMVTGQFTGEVFATQHWNPELQGIFETDDPEALIYRFVSSFVNGNTAINSLNLPRVYVLTTRGSASASELVINGLTPYIDVIQVGGTTTGKSQASTIFYDSEPPNFSRQGANPSHRYAILPLIFKLANASGYTDFHDGLPPDTEVFENYAALGVLGDEDETLLAAALDEIFPGKVVITPVEELKEAGNSKMESPVYQVMVAD